MKSFENPMIEVMKIQVEDIIAGQIGGDAGTGSSQSGPDWN